MYKVRCARALDGFDAYLRVYEGTSFERAAGQPMSIGSKLQDYGRFLHDVGYPRSHLVHAITGTMRRFPHVRVFLAAGWSYNKSWIEDDPGKCRTAFPPAIVKAIIAVALLWKWCNFAGLVALGWGG